MPNRFDASGKHIFEFRPTDWLRLLKLPVPVSLADVTVVDSDLSQMLSLGSDKLIRVNKVPGVGTYFAHIELQSGPIRSWICGCCCIMPRHGCGTDFRW